MLGFQIVSNMFDNHIQFTIIYIYIYIDIIYIYIHTSSGRQAALNKCRGDTTDDFQKITEDPTREDETELPPSVGPPRVGPFFMFEGVLGMF